MLKEKYHIQFKVFTRMLPNSASRDIYGSIYTMVVLVNRSMADSFQFEFEETSNKIQSLIFNLPISSAIEDISDFLLLL